MAKKKTTTKRKRKKPEANKTALDRGIPCPYCKAAHGHRITHTYANGNRRRICGECKRPFITIRAKESD